MKATGDSECGEGRERVLLDLREVQHCGGVRKSGFACLVCGVSHSHSASGCVRPPGDSVSAGGLTFAIAWLKCKRRKIVAKPQAVELDFVKPAVDLLRIVQNGSEDV